MLYDRISSLGFSLVLFNNTHALPSPFSASHFFCESCETVAFSDALLTPILSVLLSALFTLRFPLATTFCVQPTCSILISDLSSSVSASAPGLVELTAHTRRLTDFFGGVHFLFMFSP